MISRTVRLFVFLFSFSVQSAFADNTSLYEALVRVSANVDGTVAAGRALIAAARRVDAAINAGSVSSSVQNDWSTLRSQLTQIFVPQRMYPKGYVAAVKGGEVVSPSGAPWLLVRASRGEVSVTVAPRKDGRTQRPLETGVLPVRGEGSPESAQHRIT